MDIITNVITSVGNNDIIRIRAFIMNLVNVYVPRQRERLKRFIREMKPHLQAIVINYLNTFGTRANPIELD